MQFRYKGINLFAFSDTHGLHNALHIPADTDILICAGDAVEDNLDPADYRAFIDWFRQQPGELKFFVPGNHELMFDIAPLWGKLLFENTGITLGYNTQLTYKGLNLYLLATPTVPMSDVEQAQQADILVSHYPPEYLLGNNLQSEPLSHPAYHLFGHEHADGGKRWKVGRQVRWNVSVYERLINP
jgi:hypothetical protein